MNSVKFKKNDQKWMNTWIKRKLFGVSEKNIEYILKLEEASSMGGAV